MTIPLPLAGDTSWMDWATQIDTAARASVNVLNYGAVGDGSTNDTAALTAAIAAANSTYGDLAFVDLGGRTLSITGVTLNNYTKIRNGRLVRRSGTSPLLTLPSQGALQTTQRCVLRDLELDGVTRTTGNTGLYMGFHAAVVLDNVTVRREGVGFNIQGGQFCTAYSAKAWDCNLGLYLTTDVGGTLGGGNSWSFHDFQAVGCTAGVLVAKPSGETQPQHSIYFRNPTLIDNSVCAFAAVNIEHVVIDGSANEYTANTSPAATFTFDGFTVKKASIYASGSNVVLQNSYVAEAIVEPCITLENGSSLSITDCSGYGVFYSRLVSCDATSSTSLAGFYNCVGAVANVRRAQVNLLSPRGLAVAPAAVRDATLPNEWTSGQAPTFADTNGAASSTTGTDTVHGNYVSVTYAASIGNADSNRVRWARTFNGTATLVAFVMQASAATTLDLRTYPTASPQMIQLPAGRWVRVVWWTNGNASGSQQMVMYPTDAVGATVKVAKAFQLSGTDGPELRTQWAAALAGDYHLT